MKIIRSQRARNSVVDAAVLAAPSVSHEVSADAGSGDAG